MQNAIDFLNGKKTYGVAAIGLLYLAACGLGYFHYDEKVAEALGIGFIVTLRSALAGHSNLVADHHDLMADVLAALQAANAPAAQSAPIPEPPKGGNAATPALVTALLIAGILGGGFACARLEPGADAIVVRAEQVETLADATFSTVVHIDAGNRSFFATNSPEFHQFAEWLREPLPWGGTNQPRASVLVLSLNDTKNTYKANRANSNLVLTAIATLDAGLAHATQLLTATTNRAAIAAVK